MTAFEIRQFRRLLLRWYDKHRRGMPWRNTTDPYAIWVSEVMLQQTRVEAVIPYFERFLAAFPSVDALAEAPVDRVLKLWEGLGYYARARNLQKAARRVMAIHGGRVPDEPTAFRELCGVGPYIAAAVQSIAFGAPVAAVDGNVKRVIARLLLREEPVNASDSHQVFQPLADPLLNPKRPGDHNQAMMELGARICTPRKPACASCPVASVCAAHKTNRTGTLPRRIGRTPVPTKHIAVGVVAKKDRLLICRRREDGLLGGLWEFPGGGIETGETSADACVREILEEVNLRVTVETHLTDVTHAYTHFRIKMNVFLCRYQSGRVRLNGPVDFSWVRPGSLSRYAFPGANNKFIPLLLEHLRGQQNTANEPLTRLL